MKQSKYLAITNQGYPTTKKAIGIRQGNRFKKGRGVRQTLGILGTSMLYNDRKGARKYGDSNRVAVEPIGRSSCQTAFPTGNQSPENKPLATRLIP